MIKFITTSEKVAGLFCNDKLHNLLPTTAVNNGKKISMDIEKFEELAEEIKDKIASPKYDNFNKFICRVKHSQKKTWLLLLIEYIEVYSSCRDGENSYNVILKNINHEMQYMHDEIDFKK